MVTPYKKLLVRINFAVISLILMSGCVSVSGINNNSKSSRTQTVSYTSQITDSASQILSRSTTQNSAISVIPQTWNDNGIFSLYYDKAYQKLSTMTLQEKVGQMFLVRRPVIDAIGTIQKYHLGGFVLFGQDFKDKTADEVISIIESCQIGSVIPMIMSVDEEGGKVVRISSNPLLAGKVFQSPQQVYAKGGLGTIWDDTINKALLLKKLGLNLNLAPVADVSQNRSDFIYSRSLGQPASITAKYVDTVVRAMESVGLSSTMKHFPGFGSNINTDNGIAIDNRPITDFELNDFLPFKAGISAGAECIMFSHIIIESMDKGVPASLSHNVHEILRNQLHFTGVMMTDSLSATAIKAYNHNNDPAVKAILAGNDIIMIDNVLPGYNNVIAAADSGVISQDIIDKAVFRILAWKYAKGIIN